MNGIGQLQQQALQLHRAGQLVQAEQIYRQILAATPQHAPTLHSLGVLAVQCRRADEALGLMQKAVACDPAQAVYHHSLGEIYRELGQWALAKDCFRQALLLDARLFAAHYSQGLLAAQEKDWTAAASALAEAVRLKPDLAEAHDQLAAAYLELGRRDDALRHLQHVTACRTDSAAAHVNLGNLQQDMGRLDEAIASFQTATRLRPDLSPPHYNLGNALRAAGRLDAAAASYRQALRLAPDFAQAHNNLGSVLRDMGDLDGAAAAMSQAVRLAPNAAEPHYSLGKLLKHTGKLAEAQALLTRAIELDPLHAPSHFSLGGTLLKLRQPEQARRCYLEALRLRPNYAEPHCGLGMLSSEAGDLDQAMAEFGAALALQPALAEAHCNRGMLLLSRGEFAAGWAELEWRWRLPGASKCPPGEAWDGSPLDGRTVLLYPEQGLGDALQFIRFAPLVQAGGGRVIVGCPKRMIPILSTCAGVDELHSTAGPLPRFEVQAPLLSLPRILKTEVDSIPAIVPYLSAPAERVEHWRQALAGDGRLRVGIHWQGNPTYGGDHLRSMPLSEFAPLAAVEGVRLLSLQKGAGSEQLAAAPFDVEDLGSTLDQDDAAFCETAAVIRNLDLVVTSDTAVAHLAGALAAPVWLALALVPDWRWLLDREDSPWYPTMRLFRQSARGQWQDVFARIADELRRLVANPAAVRNSALANETPRAVLRAEGARADRQTIVRQQPTTLQSHLEQAHRAREQGRLDAAIASYHKALECEPNSVDALNNLGVTLRTSGRLEEAAQYCRRAVEVNPTCAEAHANLGLIRHDQKRIGEAITHYRQAIRLRPEMASLRNALGAALESQGDDQQAIACFREAVRLEPGFAMAHSTLGGALRRSGKCSEAIACYQEALRLDANLPQAHNGLGVALHANRQPVEALAALRRAIALKADYAEAHCNLGLLLGEEHEFASALAHFDQAEKIQPDLPLMHNNRAMLLLLLGDFAAGWPEYEWRWQMPGAPQRPAGPVWDGTPLEGRTIVLYPEQGHGDMLQFIRYAPLVKARGGRVLVGCPQRMFPILSTCQGVDEFYFENPPPPFDVHAPLVSLPGILKTDLDSLPALVPYLSVPVDLIEHWRKALPADGRLRVGINWQGAATFRWDRWRSMPLAEFAPLSRVEGVRLISLQKGAGIEQLAHAPFDVEDLGSRLDLGDAAFCDTAAVIENLDLVITSDTALAHLAGALGAPVWLALSFTPDWRWFLDRPDSPWYPTMRLFRQSVHGQWHDVFARMAEQLRSLVAARR